MIDATGNCSLREAITAANTNAAVDGCDTGASGLDTITFDPAVTPTITLLSALPTITENLNIEGPGAGVLTIDGNGSFRGFLISGATVEISGLTIMDADVGDSNGGGIFTDAALTVTDMVFTGNAAGSGGGIRSQGATLEVSNSTFTDNSTSAQGCCGGAIFSTGALTITDSTFVGNDSPVANGGGAIFVFSGTAVISGSTFDGNTTGGSGGAIFNQASLTLLNSTISGNEALDGSGGGIVSTGAGTTNISFTTLLGNSADVGGNLAVGLGHTMNVKNSIVADGTPSNCSGTAIDAGGNLTTDDTCGTFTEVTLTALNLGPLANNGGPTQTHALQTNSVAIDGAVDCEAIAGADIDVDQRGFSRPTDGDHNGTEECDSGAFEFPLHNSLLVEKVCDPTGDPGQFNFQILDDTQQPIHGVTGVDCGSFFSIGGFDAGTYTVVETAGTGTDLADYTTEFGGDCDAQGNVTVGVTERKVCTVTNTNVNQPSPTPTSTATSTSTVGPSATPTQTSTPAPSATPTRTPTHTSTPGATNTPAPSATPTRTSTPGAANTPVPPQASAPNVGGAIAAVIAAAQSQAQAAADPRSGSAPQTAGTIAPPRTGDGGLR